jgi:outer membrane protein
MAMCPQKKSPTTTCHPKFFLQLAITLLFLGTGPLSEAKPSLSMEQAVAQALARAPELHAARHAETGATSRVSQARSAYIPRLSAEVSYLARWPKNELPIQLPPQLGLPPIGEIDDVHHVRAGAGATWRLFDLARGPRLAATKRSLETERCKTREAEAALAFQVRAAFLSALFSRDLKRIGAESLEVARAEERRASLRAQVGTGSQLTLAQARVRVANLQAQYRQAESELLRYRQLLGSLLGTNELGEIEGRLEISAEEVRSRSAASSPAIERLRTSRDAAELSARSVDRAFWPTLSLSARADYEYPHVMKTEWGPLVQGGLVLSWDFFDGGLRKGQVEEAAAQARSLGELTRATEEGLARKLIDIEARARTAKEDLLSAKETLEQNEVYLRVARAAEAAGTSTSLEVHNAELGLDQARVAVQRALFAKALARAESLMIQGIALERSGGEK